MYSIMPSQNNCYIYTCNLALALAVIILLRIISIRNVTTSQHKSVTRSSSYLVNVAIIY